MSVPTYDQFIEPILRFLASKPDGSPTHEVHEAAAAALGLTAEQKQKLISSGQPTYKNRANWAHDRLKRAGLSTSERRGYWKLTDKGHAFAAEHSTPLPSDTVAHLAVDYLAVKLKAGENSVGTESAADDDIVDSPVTMSPDDRLEQALKELRAATAASLIERLLQVSPTRFELIVLDVLHSLGYGASRDDVRRVGGSGDGGIDGVIALDKLGLDKVYVQAKRWQGSVGRVEVQNFYGALAGQKAKRGVFITTSTFNSNAIEYGKSVEGIVLVDGLELVGLMMDHEVGVSSRALKIPKLDSDYFDDD